MNRYDHNHVWNWGLSEARGLQYDLHTEPSWEADEALEFINYRSYISDFAEDLGWSAEAIDLQFDLYGGEQILCYCGCGRMFPKPGGDYDRWDYDHGRDHLSYLYG